MAITDIYSDSTSQMLNKINTRCENFVSLKGTRKYSVKYNISDSNYFVTLGFIETAFIYGSIDFIVIILDRKKNLTWIIITIVITNYAVISLRKSFNIAHPCILLPDRSLTKAITPMPSITLFLLPSIPYFTLRSKPNLDIVRYRSFCRRKWFLRYFPDLFRDFLISSNFNIPKSIRLSFSSWPIK